MELSQMEAIATDLSASVAELETSVSNLQGNVSGLGGRVGALESAGAADAVAVPNVFLINSITGAVENENPIVPNYTDNFAALTNWLQAEVPAEGYQSMLRAWTPKPSEGLVLDATKAGTAGPGRQRMLLKLPAYYNEENLNKPILSTFMAVMHVHLAKPPEAASEVEITQPQFAFDLLDTSQWPGKPGTVMTGSAQLNLGVNIRIRKAAGKVFVRMSFLGYGASKAAEAELLGENLKNQEWWLVVIATYGGGNGTEVSQFRGQLYPSNPLVFGGAASIPVINEFVTTIAPNQRINPIFHQRVGIEAQAEKATVEAESGSAFRSLRIIPLNPNAYASE